MDEFRAFGRILATAISVLGAALGPWLDLAIRIWLAQAFLVVQVHEMMQGAAPSGLHGIMASSLGLAVQTAYPLLLAVELLARPAAAAMLLQALLLPIVGSGAGAGIGTGIASICSGRRCCGAGWKAAPFPAPPQPGAPSR